MQSVKEDNDVPPQCVHQDTPPNENPASALYVAEFRATVARYRDSIFQLLQSSPISAPLPNLTAHYDELRQHYYPIISSLASLITHLGGNTISEEDIDQFTRQAETNTLVPHTTPTLDTPAPPLPRATVNNDATKVDPTQAMHQDAMAPPNKPNPSLKAGKFLPTRSTMPPPRQARAIDIDPGGDEDDDNPGIYNHTIDGVGDGTHLIIASFINSLTAIGACERQLFNELCGTVVSCQIFIRSQSLIVRECVMTSSWPLLLAICTRLAASMSSIEDQNCIIFGLVNICQFVHCVAR